MSSFLVNWTISDTYRIYFEGSGAEGTFRGLEGTIRFSPDELANSHMDVRVSVATIDTGNKTKDQHARGDNWLYAEKYPYIRFVSESFRQTSSAYTVDGKLTLRGITKRISIPFTFGSEGSGKVFVGQFKVNRQDYGIEGPWLVGAAVGDEFVVKLRVPVTK